MSDPCLSKRGQRESIILASFGPTWYVLYTFLRGHFGGATFFGPTLSAFLGSVRESCAHYSSSLSLTKKV